MGIICTFLSKIYYEDASIRNKDALEHEGFRVGICPDWRTTKDGRVFYFNTILTYYHKLLESFGGRLVVLNFDADPKDFKGKLHGLIIPGGRDIDPKYYGQNKVHASFNPIDAEKRWNFCKKWLFENDPKMPIFGICFGFQVINCLFGGDMEQRIKSRWSHSKNRQMNLRPESKLAKALGKVRINGQCYHQQGLRNIPDCLQPSIFDAEDSSVHGFEYIGKDQREILGVLWHPEAVYEGKKFENHEKDNLSIFGYFFNTCKIYRSQLINA